MNFTPNRVQPEQIGEEPKSFCPGCHSPSCFGSCMQNAYRPSHVETASSEENEYTPPLTLLGYVLAFIFAIASIAFSAGYWLSLY